MEKNIGALAVIFVILSLLIGGLTGYAIGEGKIIYEDVIQEVEVPVEVEVINEVEIISTDTQPLLDDAIAAFLEEVEDDEDLQECDSEEYDEDQIAVKKVYDDYVISVDEDEYSVDFTVKVKYLDDDVEEKCYNKYDVSVLFEEDEDPEVTIL